MTLEERAEYELRFKAHWERFLRRFNVSGVPDTMPDSTLPKSFSLLRHCYGEECRHYHTMKHIVLMLDELENVRRTYPKWFDDAIEDAAIELGVWFHDVIYDPTEHGNEERSAKLAEAHARNLGLSRPVAQLARNYIRATDHRQFAEDFGAWILCDLDLMSLAAPWDEFRKMTRCIRLEYAHVPDDEFKAGRRKILESMLDRRPHIFQTLWFRDRLEHQARANLRRSIRKDLAP